MKNVAGSILITARLFILITAVFFFSLLLGFVPLVGLLSLVKCRRRLTQSPTPNLQTWIFPRPISLLIPNFPTVTSVSAGVFLCSLVCHE